MTILRETNFETLGAPRKGKVRDIYELDGKLLIVATDRLSAFDVVLPTGIEDKGKVLTRLSLFWFDQVKDIIPNHIIETNVDKYPASLKQYSESLWDRSMLVKKAKVLPVECVVRGYLAGSGWAEYQQSGTVCGIKLPGGLKESSRLEKPIFTPSTKAEEGHDLNISFEEAVRIIGDDYARHLKDSSIAIYEKARGLAETRGIIVADTKFEFGVIEGDVVLIDEVLTPDSSRFWSIKDYAPGKPQDSYDKQIVRDYLNTLDWGKTYPGPELPPEIAKKASERYKEIYAILTGEKI
ncbi:MAG: phosphoribosylaminoimidazolesuccinocarboxamide synthase [Syntrophorhabdaceae bacterium]|nr:phosphoribosylaminoimidazolesuccinocarboxamide synthase [Syntrophorhabdaceae bacterium]MDD4195785.1 phosphoribosylaminoimidazolesuccinocarboxamide synthase [Syntrophorhabdaceae bacterium]